MERQTFSRALRCVRGTILVAGIAALAGSYAHAKCNFDIDGNGQQDAATDGVLLLRWLAGVRGAALTEGALAVSPAPTRNTPADIEKFLAMGDYDIDGDSQANALTDGLLVLRYLDGLRLGMLTVGVGLNPLMRSGLEIEARLAQIQARSNDSLACKLLQIGISELLFGSQDSPALQAPAGTVRPLALSFTTTVPGGEAMVTPTIQSGETFASLLVSDDVWGLTLDATTLAPAESGNFLLRVTNGATGQWVDVPGSVMALGPSFQSSNAIGPGGGAVVTSSGSSIVFSASNVSSTHPAALLETTTPDGTRLQIAVDPTVAGSDQQFTLPDPNDPALDEAPASAGARKAFSPADLVVPYVLHDNSLGYRWQGYYGYVLDTTDPRHRMHRIPQLTPVFTTDGARYVVALPSTVYAVRTEKKVMAVLSSIMPRPSGTVNLGDYEPVLFVNGFRPSGNLGGGKSTWAQFPALMRDAANLNGKKLIPFEFRWQTDAHFVDAAGDLARAIDLISKATNKKVRVIAHSFGGVLVRSLLQGHVRGLPAGSPIAANARASIESLLTVGSPLSGIARNPYTVDGVTLPKGRDSLSLYVCFQVSCHVMGESGIIGDPAMRRVLGVGDPGTLPALLSATAELAPASGGLPAVPITVGIGLTNNRSGYTHYDAGDYLISYQGQRFSPGDSAAYNAPVPPAAGRCQVNGAAGGIEPLRNAKLVGLATVTEVVLDVPRDVRPGDAKLPTDTNDGFRHKGYLHSGITGIANISTTDGFVPEYWGIEAAPTQNCRTGASCRHAGFQLFRDSLNPVAASPEPKIFSLVAQSATHKPGIGSTFLVDAYLPQALANSSIQLRLRMSDGSSGVGEYMLVGRRTYTLTVPTNLWFSEKDAGGVLRTVTAQITRYPNPPTAECGVMVEGLPPPPTMTPVYADSDTVCKNNTLGLFWCEQDRSFGASMTPGAPVNGSPEYRLLISYSPGAGSTCSGSYTEVNYWPPVGFQYIPRGVNFQEWYPSGLPALHYLVATDIHTDPNGVSPQNPTYFVTNPVISCTAKFVLAYRMSANTSEFGEVLSGHTVTFPGLPH